MWINIKVNMKTLEMTDSVRQSCKMYLDNWFRFEFAEQVCHVGQKIYLKHKHDDKEIDIEVVITDGSIKRGKIVHLITLKTYEFRSLVATNSVPPGSTLINVNSKRRVIVSNGNLDYDPPSKMMKGRSILDESSATKSLFEIRQRINSCDLNRILIDMSPLLLKQ